MALYDGSRELLCASTEAKVRAAQRWGLLRPSLGWLAPVGASVPHAPRIAKDDTFILYMTSLNTWMHHGVLRLHGLSPMVQVILSPIRLP